MPLENRANENKKMRMLIEGGKSGSHAAAYSLVPPAAIALTLDAAASAKAKSKKESFPAPVIERAPLKVPSKFSRSSMSSSEPTSKAASTRASSKTRTHKQTLNVNENRGDMVSNVEGISPRSKRHRLDPNMAPGIPLDNKDSQCGRLMHYTTGGSHPINMSGTHVPGIRMDGQTEGEYPKGLFGGNRSAKQKVPSKAQSRSLKSPSKSVSKAASPVAASKTESAVEGASSKTESNLAEAASRTEISAEAKAGAETEAEAGAETEAVIELAGISEASKMDINQNQAHMDMIAGGMQIPPGPKRHRLGPNRAPGMPLDNKDSLCGRLIHYVTGGTHPTNMSGTHVPGIRMDGATEGVYPKGLFAQSHGAVKAFVNCFAGYFNTMGGSIPPCPGDCPPKSLNLNENSNNPNPLKKSAYEYPWSIRAGFLPESIEAFELMEFAVTESKSKSTNEKKPSNAAETTKSTTMTKSEKNAMNAANATTVGKEEKASKSTSASSSPTTTAIPQNLRFIAAANDNRNASSSPRHEATSAPADSKTSWAEDSSTDAAATRPRKCLWRELRRRRELEQEEERKRLEERRQRQRGDMIKNPNRANSDTGISRSSSRPSHRFGASTLVDKYRDQIEAKITMRTAKVDFPRIHSIQQELRLRERESEDTCTSVDSVVADIEEDDERQFQQSIDQANNQPNRCCQEWIPSAATGML